MELPIASLPRPAEGYQLPALLQDIRLLDLLELSGTTLAASRMIRLSQPTVSRRYRVLAEDFGLVAQRRRPVGCWFGSSQVIHLLRLSCRAHRLAAGVARLGTDVILQPLLSAYPWLLPAPPRFRLVENWLDLVRQGVLDGALISGLEFQGKGPPVADGLELLPLGELSLTLMATRDGTADPRRLPPTVLVPRRSVAQGLQRAIQAAGLTLQTVGNTCQTPTDWRERLQRGPVAMPLPALDPADWWEPLQRLPLPAPISLPVWLVLPEGWRLQTLLAHTAQQLRRHRALTSPAPQASGALPCG